MPPITSRTPPLTLLGTTHPSQPNYFTMISSTIAGGVFDDADHNSSQSSLVDLFEPAGKTSQPVYTSRAQCLLVSQVSRGRPTWRATLPSPAVPATLSPRTTRPSTSGVFNLMSEYVFQLILTLPMQQAQPLHVLRQHPQQHHSLPEHRQRRGTLRPGRRQGPHGSPVHVLHPQPEERRPRHRRPVHRQEAP